MSRQSFIRGVGEAIDQVLAVIAPERAELRAMARRRYLARAEKWAAAETTNATYNWRTGSSSYNDIMENSWTTVRQRSSQLVRDFPTFSGVLDRMADFVVGDGFQFQSRVMEEGAARTPDKATRTAIEAFVKRVMEPMNCDVAGKHAFNEFEALAVRQDIECGEFLAIKSIHPEPDRLIPFLIRMEAPTRLSDFGVHVPPGHALKMGIEYQTETGRPVRYHLTSDETFGAAAIPIDAGRVMHSFALKWPNQVRGITMFAPCILLAHHLQEMFQNEVEAAEMQSRWVAMITAADPHIRQRQNNAQLDTVTSKKAENIDHLIIEYLQAGEEVKFATPTRPTPLLGPFAKIAYQMIATTMGMPYELVSGDYSGLNYTTIRGSRNDFLHTLRPRWCRHRTHFCQPWLGHVLDWGVFTGQLYLRNYWLNPRRYRDALWIPPGMEQVDALREVKARLDEFRAGIRSPIEVILARGGDPETVVAQIAEFKALLADQDLSWEDFLSGPTQVTKTNPHALGAKAAVDPGFAERLEELMDEYAVSDTDLHMALTELPAQESIAA